MLIVLNKMILIKSFLTRVLYDIYANMLVFSQYLSFNVHHLNDSIYIWNYCNQAQFWNKSFLREIFYNSQFKKYNCNSTHSYNRKIWVDIPSYIIFPYFAKSKNSTIINEL